MSEVTFGQGQLEELAKFTDPQNEIIANLAKALLSTTKQRNEFAQQLSELQLSQQNIINAFGIKGEGAYSKLVIEYVHGLVAENLALKKYAKIDDYDKCDNCGFESYVMPIETPNTDEFTAELRAQGVEQLANDLYGSGYVYDTLKGYAANLRAGRKG